MVRQGLIPLLAATAWASIRLKLGAGQIGCGRNRAEAEKTIGHTGNEGITTRTFSAEAREYVSRIGPRVVHIDGAQLADYRIEPKRGVTVKAVYEVKRIDTDFFSEE